MPANRSMLDVLQDAGVAVLFNCRRGECGLCALNVIELAGEVDHRDVFFTDEEHAEIRQICTCVSRVQGSIALDLAYEADRPLLPAAHPAP